jgi:hypothetical protein
MIAAALVVGECDLRPTGPPLGVYQQSSYTKPGTFAYLALPRRITIEKGSIYEMEAVVPVSGTAVPTRQRGTFRVMRDSLFFDENTLGNTIVTAIGQMHHDTLLLRIPGVEEVSEGKIKNPIRFIRSSK